MSNSEQLTQLLHNWQQGDARALDEITPMVYSTLQTIAARYRSKESKNHTLQATEIVHEAFIRLVDANVDWQSRNHFYAIAARTMRRILVDHARSKGSDKRGGQYQKITLSQNLELLGNTTDQLLDVDTALDKLNEIDKRKREVLELHIFGGLTYDEIAEAQNISAATVDRDLRFAKAWIAKEVEKLNLD